MKIENIKDLKKVAQLCREFGINVIKIDGIEMVLEGQPQTKALTKTKTSIPDTFGEISAETKVPAPDGWDSLTDEQKLFYSAEGQQQ